MKEITLPRTGDRPVSFKGEKIATASSHSHEGPTNSRWHDLGLYQTAGGKYVLHIGWRTQWQGEHDIDRVFIEDSIEAITEQLRITNPIEHLLGFPPGEQFAQKQARVERAITQAWEVAVAELLADLPEEID